MSRQLALTVFLVPRSSSKWKKCIERISQFVRRTIPESPRVEKSFSAILPSCCTYIVYIRRRTWKETSPLFSHSAERDESSLPDALDGYDECDIAPYTDFMKDAFYFYILLSILLLFRDAISLIFSSRSNCFNLDIFAIYCMIFFM